MKTWLLLLLLTLTIGARAEARAKKTPHPKTRSVSSEAQAETRTALNSPQDAACQKAYRTLYGKDSVAFKVFFGYKDARPARFVGDRHERIAFVQRIVADCTEGRFACGFTRDADNADLFSKTIKGPTGRDVRVELFVANSSVGSDDAANRDNPFQKWQSAYAQKAYLGGLANADVVFYNGHSRFGGGPDFEPPHLAESGELDELFYLTKKPGLTKTVKTLDSRAAASAKSPNPLKVLGLFSCASDQHFTSSLGGGQGTGIISSRALVYYADALENSLAALSSLLEMRCQADFASAIRSESPVHGSRLQGFFHP